MTTLIPDSWELPSYLAGDLINMEPYRRNQPSGPDVPGRDARVFDLDYTRDKRNNTVPPQTERDWGAGLRSLEEMEPYDPEIHGRGPAELYSQDSLDALEKSGFSPLEQGFWHRPVMNDAGEHVGSHYISYKPGYRGPEGNRLPWNVTTDPEEVGRSHRTLLGQSGALAFADADAANMMKMSKLARAYLAAVWERA